MKGVSRYVLIFVLLAVNVGCDQISKAVVRKQIPYSQQIGVVPNHVTLTNIENSGSFLSFGDTIPNPWKFILLTLLPILALVGGLVFIFRRTQLTRGNLLGLCFVIGGGLGNIYDRLLYGSVTDFIHLRIGIFQTGVFNLADVSIMTGIAILLIHSYRIQARLKRSV